MKQIYLTTFILFCLSLQSRAQFYNQYFDGADTSAYNSLFIELDTNANNIWQIGSPQKTIFNSAATVPNVIVTDTLNYYPSNNQSVFTFKVPLQIFGFGILALQWKQKLNMDADSDGGIIEFSKDSGNTWENVFNNPYVYNFYGYDAVNADTLNTGEYTFSGTDSSWKDIWLCYDLSWASFGNDTLLVRFTFKSDSVNTNKEGWVIDNFMSHITFIHTVKEVTQTEYLNVYPNPASTVVHIEAEKQKDFHIIEKMELINSKGEVVDRWFNCPTKFWFKTNKYADGVYLLKIKTNLKSETLPVVIKRN
jgi:hypothetical protein